MAYTTERIDKYRLYLRSGPPGTANWTAMLALLQDTETGFPPRASQRLLATVNFTDAAQLPATRFGPSLNFWYRASMLESVMALMRLEQPVYLIHSETFGTADLASAEEPVGEEEGSS